MFLRDFRVILFLVVLSTCYPRASQYLYSDWQPCKPKRLGDIFPPQRANYRFSQDSKPFVARFRAPLLLNFYPIGIMARTALAAIAVGMLGAANALEVITPSEGLVVVADRCEY